MKAANTAMRKPCAKCREVWDSVMVETMAAEAAAMATEVMASVPVWANAV